jgi:general secretion pathway protein A
VWKVSLPDGEPCQVVQRSELLCYRNSGNSASSGNSVALLRRLGRPAIVTLRDADGKPGHALLTGLTRQTATLRAQGVSQTVSLESLAGQWRGDFATLWKAPAGFRGSIVEGSTGPAVDWLATRLAQTRGQPVPASAAVFDAAMKSQIFAFQFAQEVKADGVPGPETLMLLNRAAGVDEPRLQTEE